MKLRIGYELQYEFPQPTPAILMLNVHFTRASDLMMPDHVVVHPSVALSGYRDSFGNWCTRLVAPAGRVVITSELRHCRQRRARSGRTRCATSSR